jgi:membrane protein DedA with SNARE-associated domain
MLFMAAHLASFLPGWLQEPSWLRPMTRVIRLFILHHQAGGLFFVIFLEELGVPLPAPGDAAIAYGGYLTTTGAIPYPLAYLGVIAGAVLGSACNLTISRKYGRPFIRRYGAYIGLTEAKTNRPE